VRRLSLWGPVGLVMGAIFLTSSVPGGALPGRVPDKLAHAAVYAGLAALVARAANGGLGRPLTARRLAIAVVVATAYGVSVEIHQAFAPGRTPSGGDVAADALGAVVGAGLAGAWSIVFPRDRHP